MVRDLNSFGEDASPSKWVHFPRQFRDLLQASFWREEGSFPRRHFLGVTDTSTYVVIIFYEHVCLPDHKVFSVTILSHSPCICSAYYSAWLRVTTQYAFIDFRNEWESSLFKKGCKNIMLKEISTCTRKWCQERVPKFRFAVLFWEESPWSHHGGSWGRKGKLSEIWLCEKQAQESGLVTPQLTN